MPRAVKQPRPHTNRGPRSLRTQQLAAQLVADLPYLERRQHIGALCDILEGAFAPFGGLDALPHAPHRPPDPTIPGDQGTNPRKWTSQVITTAIDQWHHTHHRTTLAMDATNPLAWFSWVLRQALTPEIVERLRTGLTHAAAQAPSAAEPRTNSTATTSPPAGAASWRQYCTSLARRNVEPTLSPRENEGPQRQDARPGTPQGL